MGQRPSITPPNFISSAMAPTPAAVISPPEQEFSTLTCSKRKHESEWLTFLREFQETEEEKERRAEEREKKKERERREEERRHNERKDRVNGKQSLGRNSEKERRGRVNPVKKD